jgi:peptidoglycan-associated lipoprotein
MKRFYVLALILGLIGFGCAQQKAVAPETEQPVAVQPQTKTDEGVKKAEQPAEQPVAKVESKDIPSKEAPSKTEEISGMFNDIHFDYDRYDIRADARPALKSIADYLIKNNSNKLLVEGHCDERGTNEYNLALGDKRAKATKDYLVSLGVPSSRIEILSYGEEKPLCKEQNDGCWAKNRRAHFIVMKGKK